MGLLRACVAVAVGALLAGCPSRGGNVMTQGKDQAAARAEARQQEEFAKSLPPTQAKPVYRP